MNSPFDSQLALFLRDTVATPGNLLVPSRSIEPLVKAEARRIADEANKTRFFSQFAFQNMTAWGAREKPQGTATFNDLHMAYERSFVDRIIIQAHIRKHRMIWQRARTGKQVGFQVVHDRHDDPTYEVTDSDLARCEEMMQLLSDPTPAQYTKMYPHEVRPHRTLKDFMSEMLMAEMKYDRKCMQRYKRADGKGYAAFHGVPPETIKNVDEAIRQWAYHNEQGRKVGRDTVAKMTDKLQIDIANCAYVQVVDGMVVRGFAADEISVHVANPTGELNRFGYGQSELEISLDVTAMLIRAWHFNRNLFEPKFPDTIIKVNGGFDKNGLEAWKQQMYAETDGQRKVPVIDGSEEFSIEAIKVRDSVKDMMYPDLLRHMIMFKAAAYGEHPSILNFAIDDGKTSSIGQRNPEGEIEAAKDNSFHPRIFTICDWLTEDLIKPRYADLRLVITGLEPEDEKQVIDLRNTRVKGWVSRNDIRMEEGKQPRGYWVPDDEYERLADDKRALYDTNPWNLPADQPIAGQMMNLNMMQAQGEEGEDDPNANEQQPKKQEDLGKSRREGKYLMLELED